MTRYLATLTPYVVPPELSSRKAVNIGDGFILRAIERLLGSFDPAHVFTSRAAPDERARQVLEASAAIILAGANQLSDRFSVWPGATAADLRRSRARFIPFAIGIHGAPGFNDCLTQEACEQIRVIHERIEFSSWRCPATIAYLERWLPELKGRFLMTCCPVVFGAPLLEGATFHDGTNVVAVTVTERGAFWDREVATLRYVAQRYQRARRLMVLHQDFEAMYQARGAATRTQPGNHIGLRDLARSLGYELVAPANADIATDLYRTVDLHYGSRLHAHLHFLGQAKRSWLTPVDGRATGLADALGFPICDPLRFDSFSGFDFEIVRANARKHFNTMSKFVRSIV